MKKKYVFIAVGILIFIICLLSAYLYLSRKGKQEPLLNNPAVQDNAPVFMTAEEKASLFIPEDKNIQVINRGEDGEILTYKIINSDKDIVSPGRLFPTKPADLK